MTIHDVTLHDTSARVPLLVDGETIDYSRLPEHMQDAMRRYLEQHKRPGDFLCAVLQNDLMGAVGHADDINMDRLRDYAVFLHNNAPPDSYGRLEKFVAWLKS